MASAHLTRQLVLEAAERVADGAGGFHETWEPLGVVWAEVTARSGRETSGEGTSVSRNSYRIIVRAAPVGAVSRPVAGQRFVEGARVFAISAVAESDVQGRYLTCFVEEEVAL